MNVFEKEELPPYIAIPSLIFIGVVGLSLMMTYGLGVKLYETARGL